MSIKDHEWFIGKPEEELEHDLENMSFGWLDGTDRLKVIFEYKEKILKEAEEKAKNGISVKEE